MITGTSALPPDIAAPLANMTVANQDSSPVAAPNMPTVDASGPMTLKGPVADTNLTFAQKMARTADVMGIPSPQPGGWARSLVGAAQQALAGNGSNPGPFTGVGDIGTVPPGAGALYGVGKVMQARQAAKQQMLENQRQAKSDDILHAYTTAQTVALQRAMSRADEEEMDRHIASGRVAADAVGKTHEPLGTDITEDQLLAGAKTGGKYDHNTTMAYQTGTTQIVQGGKIVNIPTYTVFNRDGEQTKVSDEAAALMGKYLPKGEAPTAGTNMDEVLFDHLFTKAQSAQGTANLLNAQAKKEKLDKLTDEQVQQHADDLAVVNPYIGVHASDPITALQQAASQKDKDGKPTDVSLAASRLLLSYDPKDLETHRHNLADEAEKKEKDASDAKEKLADLGIPFTNEMAANINALPPDKKAVLQSAPQDVQALLYTMATSPGDFNIDAAFPGRVYKGTKTMSLQQAGDIISQLVPGWSEQAYRTMAAEYKNMTTGDKSDAIGQYNNVLKHSSNLQDVMNDSLRQLNPAILNHTLNWLQTNGYGTEVAKIATAQEPLKGEMEQLMAGGYKPSETMQKAYDQAISLQSRPDQVSAALKELATTGAIRLDTLNERYKTVSGGRNFPNLVDPQALASAKHLGLEGTPTWNTLNQLSNAGGRTLFQQLQPQQQPQLGASKTFPNGNVGVWDGKGYVLQPKQNPQ